jgi:hypothetical protein
MLPEHNAPPIFESMDPKVTICQTLRAHIPGGRNSHHQSMARMVRDRGLKAYKTTGASRP